MATVGIIANPASGKDIRRLVSYGTVFDNQEKVNIVRRIILGLSAVGVARILYMPDYYGIVPQALDGLKQEDKVSLEVERADIELTADQQDSLNAAISMRESGVGCIVTLGGDGTNRMVAKGCGNIPLLPVSTGTNNVFPGMIEGTVAGMAAGVVALGIADGPPAVMPSKKLVIYKNGQPVDIALIDAVTLRDRFVGARAIWETERLLQAVVTRGEPHNIGIASVVGNIEPVIPESDEGMALEFGGEGRSVLSPIAPGLIVKVGVKGYKKIMVGDEVRIIRKPCIIALDGEREVEVKEDEEACIKLTFDGPRVVDVRGVLHERVKKWAGERSEG